MTVFYRKYRPQKFADLVGQEQVVKTLLLALESGKISHGYLFCGPRGTGKTSTARIIAKAVNCQVYSSRFMVHGKKVKSINDERSTINKFGEPCNKCQSCISITDGSNLDVIEIDAASNRGIDEIRDLREKVRLSPVSSRFKVYIIDEAHMLTMEAFNAFLKTLEEPPAHVIFILCTTAPAKLPPTIISRLARFNFSRATQEDLVRALEKIAKKEDLKIEVEALEAIAKAADGSFRDAASVLDQLASSGKKIRLGDVLAITLFSGWNKMYEFVGFLVQKKLAKSVDYIEKINDSGGDIGVFAKETILFLEKLLLIKIGMPLDSFDETRDQLDKMATLAQSFDFVALQNLMKLFLVAEGEIKIYPLPQIPLVLAVCRFCGEPSEVEVSKVSKVPEVSEVAEVLKASKGADVAKVAKASKAAAKSLAKIEEKWGEFLNKVKPINAHLVALLRSSRPANFDGTNLTVEVFFRFHKEKLEEPKIRDLLTKVLEEVMGENIKLSFILADKETRPPRAVVASDVAEVGGDELSKIAQEIFSE